MKIGFIGLGAMGAGMARRLREAGHQLTVYDASEETLSRWRDEGVATVDSPRAMPTHCSLIFLSLPGDEITENVCLEPQQGLVNEWTPQHVLVDLGTSCPASSQKVAEALAQRGGRMLDAPVSGGAGGAHRGTLSIMVGGPRDLYDEMLPLFQILGRDIAHVGPNGCGQAVKGVNQLVMGLADAVFMEALAYGMSYGVEPAIIAEVLQNAGASQVSFVHVAQKAAQERLAYSNVKIHDLRRFVPDAVAQGLTLPASQAALTAVNLAPLVEDPENVTWPTWPPGGARPSYWNFIWQNQEKEGFTK